MPILIEKNIQKIYFLKYATCQPVNAKIVQNILNGFIYSHSLCINVLICFYVLLYNLIQFKRFLN